MDIAKIFKKMLSSSEKERKLNKIEILDFKVVGYKTNPLYFWRLPECEMTFIAKNGQTYIAYNEFTELFMYMEINIKGLNPESNRLITNIDETNFSDFGIKYERIDVQKDLQGVGIGSALQDMMNKIFFFMAQENNINFLHIHGVIGVNGNDDPEKSMRLYKSFDGKIYDIHKLTLNSEGFNTTECNLEYFIS